MDLADDVVDLSLHPRRWVVSGADDFAALDTDAGYGSVRRIARDQAPLNIVLEATP